MIRMPGRTILFAASLLAGLSGCAGRTYYADLPEPHPPVAQVQSTSSQGSSYTVQRGDSLYSIAFGAGRDWRAVAAANGIGPPYTIHPGQQLRLDPPAGYVAAAEEPQTSYPGSTTSARVQAAPEQDAPIVASSTPAASSYPAPAAAPPPIQPAQPRTQPQAAAPASAPVAAPPPGPPGSWQWPSSGKMFLGFTTGQQPHKGIDIAGAIGDPVLAARNGTVVYAGDGVRGYGNLLIIKHDAVFLSAYAHNSKLLVKEGESVRGGQKIAELGDSATDRPKLHFEVRKQGNPIDPLQVLPRR
jgi:lipoprotein NlpD